MQEQMKLLNSNGLTVNVIDSIMGSGKTTWVVDKINKDKNPKYIVVTPTLSEVARIKEDCPRANFKEPEKKQHGGKYYSLKLLVQDGENIVTTHSLFQNLTTEILDGLRSQHYKLVIDEALSCVETYRKINPKDLQLLFSDGWIYVEPDTHKLRWNNEKTGYYKGQFHLIKKYCNNGNLIYFEESTMLWEFPIEFLSVFKEVWILTYMFKGSGMANYLLADGTKTSMYSLKGKASKGNPPQLIKYEENDEQAIKEVIRKNVTLYEGKLNEVGASSNKKSNPLSKTWLKNNPEKVGLLKRNLNSYFRYVLKCKSEDIIWTTFGKDTDQFGRETKGMRGKLQGRGYSKGFIANNTKATNQYIDKSVVAYMQNTFYVPVIRRYFTSRNVKVYEELFSLCEMIQLIWRSRIRKHEPISVYIPSLRMRHLFKAWLESNNNNELLSLIMVIAEANKFVEKAR